MFISSIFYYQIRVRVLSQEMATDTPQSAPAGVFLYKYGCLCPAANFHRGIFVQIWVSIPRSQLLPGYFCANMGVYTRSQLLPGYFCANMGVYTPQPTFAGVFPRKNGYLCPGTPAPYQNFHTLRKFSTFSQFHFNSRNRVGSGD